MGLLVDTDASAHADKGDSERVSLITSSDETGRIFVIVTLVNSLELRFHDRFFGRIKATFLKFRPSSIAICSP